MANTTNLVPHQFTSAQSREQAALNGRKGGRATQAKRREAAQAREVAKMALDLMPDLPKQYLDTLYKLGLSKKKKKPDMRILSTMAIAQKGMKGDKDAYKFLLELAGEVEKEPTVNINTFIGEGEAQDNSHLVQKTMDRMTDEQLRVFEEICALYSEVEAEEAERAVADYPAEPEPIEVRDGEGTVQ